MVDDETLKKIVAQALEDLRSIKDMPVDNYQLKFRCNEGIRKLREMSDEDQAGEPLAIVVQALAAFRNIKVLPGLEARVLTPCNQAIENLQESMKMGDEEWEEIENKAGELRGGGSSPESTPR